MTGKYLEQTDRLARATPPSTIQVVLWTKQLAVPGGRVGLEILTHFVGNGSRIEIELSDQNGKTFGKYTEKIFGNHFWTQVKVPGEARQVLYADIKLPKHGLQMKSNPLILLPAIEITNVKWDKKEAWRGDILKLTADVKGVQDGVEGEISIWEYDSDGAHDLITKFPVFIKSKKIEAEWKYEYHEDTDEIPTEEELQNYGNHYNPPEYFFRLRVGEVTADSRLLEFRDWIALVLYDSAGNPMKDVEYKITLPDGNERSGKLDENGYAKEDDIPPGKVTIKWNLKDASLF